MTGNLDDLRDQLLHGNMGGIVAEFEAAVRADEQDKMCAIIAIAAQAATP